MATWSKRTRQLPKSHGWKSKPGYQIFVADRGAVRFDFPVDWTVVPGTDSIKLYDRAPPDETCGLQMTVFYLPGEIDFSALPVADLLAAALQNEEKEHEVLSRTEMFRLQRGNMDLAWMETRYMEAKEKREAIARRCLARALNIQPFISFDYWADDVKRLEPVWNEMLRTLRLGEFVQDPLRGPRRKK